MKSIIRNMVVGLTISMSTFVSFRTKFGLCLLGRMTIKIDRAASIRDCEFCRTDFGNREVTFLGCRLVFFGSRKSSQRHLKPYISFLPKTGFVD